MLRLPHIKNALERACLCDASATTSPQVLHKERSIAWVRCLANEFRQLYPDPDIRVFFKADSRNRTEFGLNELLFDICVCRTDECESARKHKSIRYVSKALWQVESEFARDSSEAVKDFNKLVIGSAENKLFIGPTVSDKASYLRSLLPVACACGGNVYMAFVPHPSEWGSPPLEVLLYEREGNDWKLL